MRKLQEAYNMNQAVDATEKTVKLMTARQHKQQAAYPTYVAEYAYNTQTVPMTIQPHYTGAMVMNTRGVKNPTPGAPVPRGRGRGRGKGGPSRSSTQSSGTTMPQSSHNSIYPSTQTPQYSQSSHNS